MPKGCMCMVLFALQVSLKVSPHNDDVTLKGGRRKYRDDSWLDL